MNRIKSFYAKQQGIAPIWQKTLVSLAVGFVSAGILHAMGAPQAMVTGVSAGITASIFLTFGRSPAK